MDLEHDVKLIRLDQFDEMMKQLQAEGYMAIPGVVPVIVYHVVRPKGFKAGQGVPGSIAGGEHKVEVKIHDHRVFTLRDGKYYTEDGQEVPEGVIKDPNHPDAPKAPN